MPAQNAAPSSASDAAARRRAAWLRENAVSWLFCAPALLLYGGFIVLPALLGFGYSLTDWNGWGRPAKYVGLANFKELLGDDRFLASLKFTLLQTVLIVVFFTFGAMILAVLLDRLRVMKGLIRGLFFYPYVLSILVSALVFQYLANYREGALNVLLCSVGLEQWTQNWMSDPSLVPLFIFVLVAWTGLGFFTTLYLANLQTIPVEMYEAAGIDGAGPLAIFTRIQFPMLLPTITTNSVMALILGINLFPQIVVTTQGGPGYRTFTVGYYIYWLGILNNRQGYATAVSLVMFVALAIVAVVQVGLLRRRETQL